MKILLQIIIVAIISLLTLSLFFKDNPLIDYFANEDSELSENDSDDDDEEQEDEEEHASGDADDDDDDVPLRLVEKDGLVYVNLNEQQQEISGLKTIRLQPQHFKEEVSAYGNVIALEKLQEDKANYELIQADIEIAKINLSNTNSVYQNLRTLNKKTANVSSRKLLEAKAARDLNASELNRLQTTLQNHNSRMLQKWGAELVEIMFSNESVLYDEFINFKKSLILMSLKPNQSMPDNVVSVYVNKSTDRLTAREAHVISSSNVINSTIQGESFYLYSDSKNLRPGMRLNVWIPINKQINQGVVIPDSAVIWHSGMPWAYVKTDEEFFIRKVLVNPVDTGAGWFVAENFNSDDEIVVQGAQLLLSEEFRSFIPDEDDDP